MIRNHRDALAWLSAVSTRWRLFRASARGATVIEYALIAALIILVIFVSLGAVRDSLLSLPFPTIISAFTAALGKL